MTINKYNLGQYSLSMVSAGQAVGPGSPVVVLETGLGVGSETWGAVQEILSQTYQTIRYDRAGRGESDPAPKPRSALDLAADLHNLLAAAGIEAPLILVGQSFGGLLVRLYAGLHPERVAGLVLVEPTLEGQFERAAAALPPSAESDSPGLARFRQFWTQGYRLPENNQEGVDLVLSEKQVAPYRWFGGLPVVILSGDQPLPELADRPAEAEKLQQMWWDLRQEQTSLSQNARHIVVRSSGHFIQVDQPQAVAEAVYLVHKK